MIDTVRTGSRNTHMNREVDRNDHAHWLSRLKGPGAGGNLDHDLTAGVDRRVERELDLLCGSGFRDKSLRFRIWGFKVVVESLWVRAEDWGFGVHTVISLLAP